MSVASLRFAWKVQWFDGFGTYWQRVGQCVAVMALSTACVHAKDRLDAGRASVGMSWVTESPTESGWEAKMKYSVTSDLEVALSASTIRDTAETPLEKINGVGLELSWWPVSLSEEMNLGVSVTLSDGEKSVSNGRDAAVMLEGELGILEYQWDIGYDYSRNGSERESTWGTAFSLQTDLTQRSALEIELTKDAGEKPGVELSYEYDAWKNLELNFSIGREDKTTFYAFGFEYKF
jgi:hypothetical protein